MSRVADHITPEAALWALLRPLAQEIAAEITRQVSGSMVPANMEAASQALRLKPFYTAKELAARWNFSKTDTIYEIPENELPRRRVGSGRGKTLFYVLDVLVYEQTLTRKEADAFQKAQLSLLENSSKESPRLRRLGHPVHPR